VQDP
jgi:transposase